MTSKLGCATIKPCINLSWLIIPIILLGFVVRVYKIDTPLADWHSWRQADTASVAVEYVKHGIDLLHPKYMDLSNIPSGMENPEGFRMVEFPLIPALVALIFKTMQPFITMELSIYISYFDW
jgi:hypothetical protein